MHGGDLQMIVRSQTPPIHQEAVMHGGTLAFVETPPDIPRLWVALCGLVMFLH